MNLFSFFKKSKLYKYDIYSKEFQIPVSKTGIPDFSYYKKPLEYYIEMYEEYLRCIQLTFDWKKENKEEIGRYTWALRTNALWALISKGSEAIHYALKLLNYKIADAREDAGGILAAIGKDDNVVREIIQQLEIETDQEAQDSLIMALGQLKNKLAINQLIKIIENEDTDGDTLDLAIESLGKIVRKNFKSSKKNAIEWINKNKK